MPLLSTLFLLTQAPQAPQEPITLLVAPSDTVGVPTHIVEFAQEHVTEQARAKGLSVKRMKDILRRLPAARRRALLRCKRTELRCLTTLGQVAKTEIVLVAELIQRPDGYRVGTKIYNSKDGALVAEHSVPGVREDGMLDALTQALDVVVPKVTHELRPGSAPAVEPVPTPPEEPTPTPTLEPAPEVKPGEPLAVKPPELVPSVKPDVKPDPQVREVKPSHPWWTWMPAAGGAVTAGAGTYFYFQAKKKHDALKNSTSANPLLDADQIAKDGKRHQLLSRIGFGLGVAGVATSTVLYLLPQGKSSVKPTVTVGPGGGMVGVAGTLP
ncbi:hypothetical protein POL68_20500 [Stigmatella sp. ncwal1]|uniref:Uncharacterized protein n=1 Tax=Stigmatella ashevillensis TaxID=2995309 RepID=A0ABT5DEW0_9BACT|nr:hypothetical protein [Stigmatella ashevillena]MDC0710867.1 hypothetical protein [Stigmatella ashevillena]